MSAKRTETYSAAAARRAVENLMMERAGRAEARLADTGLGAARKLVCPKGSEPGAFSAVACVTDRYDHELGMFVEPHALRPLPRAVLVHLRHDLTSRAVAVGVPTFADGAISVDAVFSSTARDTWARVASGEVRSVSIFARANEFFRGAEGRLVQGTLVSVDLVPAGADEKAHLTRLVAGADLTPAQREVQARFDRYLADPASPLGVDLFARAARRGNGALEPLRSVVAPLLEGTAAASLRPRQGSSLYRGDQLPEGRVLIRSSTRCGASVDGFKCEHPVGHGGMHFGETREACMAWDDRVPGSSGRRRASVS